MRAARSEEASAAVPLPIVPGVDLPDSDLSVSFVRAGGPGGQNVNKVASAVQLRFDMQGSRCLSAEVKQRLRTLSGRRLTAAGQILIIARNHRDQEQNRRDAERRLTELIRRALVAPKPRKATQPTRGARERRLQHKAHAQRAKRLRARPRWDE
jgi:ribosome-associated protein